MIGPFLFCGGKTAGHANPALAIALALREIEPDAPCYFVGTLDGIESRLVPERGFPLETIPMMGMPRGLSARWTRFPFVTLRALLRARKLIRRIAPVVAVGTGGFVSAPVLFWAQRMNIPTVLQEQNAYPGLVTRWLSEKARTVFLAEPDAASYLPKRAKVEHCANPLIPGWDKLRPEHAELLAALPPDLPKVLVTGGSQGAAGVNHAVAEMLRMLDTPRFSLIWQTGNAGLEDARRVVTEQHWPAQVEAFIPGLSALFVKTDLVIARAGALTIAELAAAARPAILIPLPTAAEDHQTTNARALDAAGAAIHLSQVQAGGDRLGTLVMELLSEPERRKKIGEAIARRHDPEAARRIAIRVLQLSVGGN